MMIPDRNGSELSKTLPYCTCQSKGTKDYIHILGFGLELACK